MDQSQQNISTRDSLRKIRQEARTTRSLEILRQHFEQLNAFRRQALEDFDLQVMIGDIHQEIIDRARYLRGDSPTPSAPRDDHSVIFQAPVAPPPKPVEVKPAALIEGPKPGDTAMVPVPKAEVTRRGKLKAATHDDSTLEAHIPPEVTRVDPKSWQMIVGLAAFLSLIVLVGFFYLIQTARKLNIDDDNRTKTEQIGKPVETALNTPVSITPTLRIYTDLTAGTVTLNSQPARSLAEGELTLDNLPRGQHSVRVAGSSGSAAFLIEVEGKNAPKVVGVPQATNALAVLVSQQGGRGQLTTSAGKAQILLDGKDVGEAGTAGLELVGLGNADHDLQVVHDRDRQRFVMTYTPAPVLTIYVKSDSNSGILQVVTGEDGVEVFIDNTLIRRKTERGQIRISVRAGKYPIRVHKDGFIDPPPVIVEVKRAEVTPVQFQLSPAGELAVLQIRGAQAGTTAYLDHEFVAGVTAEGAARISNIKPGEHLIELRHDQEGTKRLTRTFKAGEVLTLAGADVTLEKTVETKPVSGTSEESGKPASNDASLDGAQVRKGGGFVPYDTPKSPGHYSFRTQGRVGGFLKKAKLQWYAAYQDSQNYVLFALDGKHAEVREIRRGKNILWSRISYNLESSSWVQVDLAVKPGTVSSRVKTGNDGWVEVGSVASYGRDFTQDKVGFYIPPNDEVAVANFKFANR